MAVLMLAISALVFLIINFAPGGPFDTLMFGTGQVTQAQIDRLNESDRPQQAPGTSATSSGSATSSRATGAPPGASPTASRSRRSSSTASARRSCSMGVATLIAVGDRDPIGIYSAVRQYSWIDYLVTAFSYFGLAMPTFWFGIMPMIVFSVYLGWLPTSGMHTPGLEGDPVDLLSHLAMPVTVLALIEVAVVSRFMRSAMLEVLSQDYLRTARAKGLRERVVIAGTRSATR